MRADVGYNQVVGGAVGRERGREDAVGGAPPLEVGGGRLGHFKIKASFGGNGWSWVAQGYAICRVSFRATGKPPNHHRSLGQMGARGGMKKKT